MKKMLGVALCAALLAGFVALPDAHAAKRWDDLSWWGESGATPDPYKDPRGRNAYWWYPTNPVSNAGDSELWGNRGKILHDWVPAAEVPQPPPPPPVPQPPITRETPALDNVLFDFDKAVLKPEGQAVADKAVTEMRQYPNDTLLLVGHTDSIGSDQYNLGLGQRRADAVRRYMVDSGIDANRIRTESRGESEPAVANDTPANRKLNRRVVFHYTIGN